MGGKVRLDGEGCTGIARAGKVGSKKYEFIRKNSIHLETRNPLSGDLLLRE